MIYIVSNPSSSSILNAYSPVLFTVLSSTSSAIPSPIVYCDVYFDGIYFGTIANTSYDALVGPYGQFSFDIQDKCQEYLRTTLKADVQAAGDDPKHSTEVFVYFRDAEYDTNGILTSTYTAPIAGDFYNAPVAGDGEPTDSFYILNASLRRNDPFVFIDHLNFISPQYGGGFLAGYNLSHRPNVHTPYSYSYGGGKYYIGRNDRDVLSFFSTLNAYQASSFVNVSVVYKNGTTANQTKTFPTLPYGNLTNTYKTHWIDAGPVTLSQLFTSLTWANVKEYTVYIGGIFLDFCFQKYYINDLTCKDRVRVFFQNILGGIDGINCILEEEVSKVDSELYQKTNSDPFTPSRQERGLARKQVSQVDILECYTEEYPEADLPWLKELIGTPQAWVQEDGSVNGISDSINMYSINILDTELITKKKDDKFVYTVAFKFTYANPVINLRS